MQLVEKIIPAFEQVHRAGHQALFFIDNSQGHSAYSEDALLISHMNVKPGGKQAHMHDGWYICNGQKIIQQINLPANHTEYPNELKGIKAILTEHSLYQQHMHGKCKSKCDVDATDCCNKHILECELDFCVQKSLVQEVIESAGHLCLFLLKFHRELNFIEYFWGMVKKYLCDNCNYTFDTLKENMPQVLAAVPLHTICRWEHQMYQWMEAYRSGLGTNDAQLWVQQFSSTKYKSHRCIADTVSSAFN